MFISFIAINKTDVINQRIEKNMENFLNFLTLKGCIHFKGENFRSINKIKTIKFIFWLVPKI